MAKKVKENIVYDLYAEQPAECRQPLPFKELDKSCPEYIRRGLLYDPAPLYERIRFKINCHTRYNLIGFNDLFPEPTNSLCQCGCGQETARNSSKWHSSDCQRFARVCYDVISCRQPPMLTFYLKYYYGGIKCVKCGGEYSDLDHRIPIKGGSGGCWFSNYDMLCRSCHELKTASDNNWLKSKRLQ